MKIKQIISILFLTGIIVNGADAQVPADSVYFGQTPPGDSAVVFSPDFISTNGRFVQSSSFSMDSSEFCFVQTNSSWNSFKIKYTKYENDHWTDPADLYFLGENIHENYNFGPCFSPDSIRFYLLAVHVTESFGSIWYAIRNGNVWNEPVKIPYPVSSSDGQGEPTVSYRNTLFFARNGAIHFSELEGDDYLETTRMNNPINTSGSTDIDPYISPDEDYLIFSSNRKTGMDEEFDLYISYKKADGKWTNSKDLGPKINTTEWECVPSVTPDGKYLIFTRRDGGVGANSSKLYWVKSSFIDSLKFTNYDPYVLNMIPNQTDTAGNLYSYTIPDTTFFDDDGNETFSLTASLSDDNDLPDSLTFDPLTNTISGRLKEAGSFNIKITATDTADASISDVFRLTIHEEPTQIREILTEETVFFPNPALKYIIVKSSHEIKEIEIFDLNGHLRKYELINSPEFTINLAGLEQGNYFIKVLFFDERYVTKKLIIQ